MARTRASVAAKVATGKSSKARCSAAPTNSTVSSSSSNEKSSRSYSGGNPVCPRETPKWQKPITNFFITNQSTQTEIEEDDNVKASTSKSKPKRNVIESDDEDKEDQAEVPKNRELEESIVLEPLNGEECHKIEDYYTSKDKGKGKKSNKENMDINVKTNKRSLEEVTFGDESEHVKKKVKTN